MLFLKFNFVKVKNLRTSELQRLTKKTKKTYIVIKKKKKTNAHGECKKETSHKTKHIYARVVDNIFIIYEYGGDNLWEPFLAISLYSFG